ncbi:MAG: carboxypeptidase-like regulatory domain-containing protein [Pseudomonadota bacterium]
MLLSPLPVAPHLRRAVLLTALLTAGACFSPRNPYDERTPLIYQAAARVDGAIQAVYAPYEEDAQGQLKWPEAASCAQLVGDHAGFEVVLRGLGTASDNGDLRVQSQQTDSNGRFGFINIQPGDYSIEFLRPGFDLPPPLSMTLVAGQHLQLPTRCAVNRTPPPRPQIAAVPAQTQDDSIEIEILSCDPLQRPGEIFEITRRRPDGSDVLGLELPDASGACHATLSLLPAQVDAARVLWRLEVVARDALDNRSEALQLEIVRDTLAPAEPEGLQARVGRERVELRWQQPAPLPDDDDAAAWFVSYSLVPRPASLATARCPHGERVEDDPFESARFALEGPSPVETVLPALVLNGLRPGTDVYLQVAAVDAVGNTSCWSQALAVRPDEVTPILGSEVENVPRGVAVARSGAARAYALGSGGLAVVPDHGAAQTLTLPSHDVVAGRNRFFAAGDALGVHEVMVDVDGAESSSRSVDVGAVVRSLAARPGVLVLGTASGITLVRDDFASAPRHHLPGGITAPTERVLSWGQALILLRAAQPYTLQVVRRDAPDDLLGSFGGFATAPPDLELIGDTLWIALEESGVQAIDLDACAAALAAAPGGGVAPGELGCLAPRLPVPLPIAARAVRLAAFDDLVAIAAESVDAMQASAGLYFLRAPAWAAPSFVGRLGLEAGASIRALEAVAPGLCVTTEQGAEVQRRCAVDLGQDLIGETQRLFWGLPVTQALVDGANAWLVEGGGADVLSFAPALRQVALGQTAAQRVRSVPQSLAIDPSGSTQHARFPFGAPWLTSAATMPGLGVLAIDVYGRLWFSAHSSATGSGELQRVDTDLPERLRSLLPALARSTGSQSFTYLTAGSLQAVGLDLLLTLQNGADDSFACHPTALARIALAEDLDSGVLEVRAVEAVTLEDSVEIYAPVVDGARAWLGAQPFGLYLVELGTTLQAPAGQGLALDCAQRRSEGSYVYDLLRPQRSPDALLLSGRRSLGSVDETGVYRWSSGAPQRVDLQLPSAPEALADLGPRLFVSTQSDGAYVLDMPTDASAAVPSYPRMALPELRRPSRVVTTSRGLLVPDGLYGAAWVVVQ